MGLPEAMQTELAAFFKDHERWLAELFARGRASGVFGSEGSPEALARLALSALEGGLLIKRTTGEVAYIDQLTATLRAMLMPR
jgi:hypothetical protein